MNLLDKIKKLPNQAGVYQYFDKDDRLLYVGKAKILKNRVKSYFKFVPDFGPSDKLSSRIKRMIIQTKDIQWIVVPREHDALILENSLIKQLKPKYNILLRDDKTYPYIYIDYNDEFPRLEITRKVKKGVNIKYFGPYSIGAKNIIDSIYELIPLVQKKNCLKGKKACLFYQIKKCCAPCENKISKEEYLKYVEKAIFYIHNKDHLIRKLKLKMEEYSNNFKFEEALSLRDRIKNIEKSQIKSSMDFTNNEDLDLFAINVDENKAILLRMFIRDGKLASTNHDLIKLNFNEDKMEIDYQELFKRALVDYYSNDIPLLPKEVLINYELENKEELEQFLFEKFNKKIKIIFPKRDKKSSIVQVANENCKELLRIENNNKESLKIYDQLQELFGLTQKPYLIESFDNSHMMGQAIVGAMIVWDEREKSFSKSAYRHYNLSYKDEYSQMEEMLTRRVKSFAENQPPDLWVIDGGSTLLKLAYDVIESFGGNLDIIAVSKEKIDAKSHRAKGSAKDIVHFRTKNGQYKSLKLLTTDKRLQFVQRLRDEAHRFAITFHKKQKRKEDKQISLLEIKGIGEAKVKKLLLYFGEFEKIKNASLEELKNVLSEKDANTIKEYFIQG